MLLLLNLAVFQFAFFDFWRGAAREALSEVNFGLSEGLGLL